MNSEIILETKLVEKINGNFYIPSYQRGYRWGQEEVTRLLEDVYASGSANYCLQPIVVKKYSDKEILSKGLKPGEWFEVVDGQQRLTTLFLIYTYVHKASGGFLKEPSFTLVYQTREESGEFLKNIDMSMKEDNIDYLFICTAYETIEEWFSQQDNIQNVMMNIYKYFSENVKVIWYEVDPEEDAISLFTRLNIGKIPLTSAELVKALFLAEGSTEKMTIEKQEEISLQWDNIEKTLQNEALWYFISNSNKARYQTRIDIVLDLIAEKKPETREKYYTFFYFDRLRHEKGLDDIWLSIQQTFLSLIDWFENHELYHKIGYLIASEYLSLQEIYNLSLNRTKDSFREILDLKIADSIRIADNYAELSYEKASDKDSISRLLLLFNVISVLQNGEQTQWFPFDKFKYSTSGKINWSLEHIHAQQSEGLRTEDTWREWLTLHLPSIKVLDEDDDLYDEIIELLEKPKIERKDFEEKQEAVVQKLSVQGNTLYLHSIGNLALLNTSDNAALNNSTFDVKRNEIIKMDRRGQYIPFCTKMVFLKYYTPSEGNQLHFWGQADRIAYIEAINSILNQYLDEPIQTEIEEA